MGRGHVSPGAAWPWRGGGLKACLGCVYTFEVADYHQRLSEIIRSIVSSQAETLAAGEKSINGRFYRKRSTLWITVKSSV